MGIVQRLTTLLQVQIENFEVPQNQEGEQNKTANASVQEIQSFIALNIEFMLRVLVHDGILKELLEKNKDKGAVKQMMTRFVAIIRLLINRNNSKTSQLVNRDSLRYIFEVLTIIFKIDKDLLRNFVSTNGFTELLALKGNESVRFSGFVHVFSRFFEVLIVDDLLLNATIECALKKGFYDEGRNVRQLPAEKVSSLLNPYAEYQENISTVVKELCSKEKLSLIHI
eukprot:TRINITY_DN15429_c0_g1_i2.p1 TRINITY_DN15429_c0_g1~~TRINITY_DN15429_c0_g1_i2.p1  ORF type:complete len:226 (+),score=73.72 TRINITY_DN15429_c0_g1_i2:94-771(+)